MKYIVVVFALMSSFAFSQTQKITFKVIHNNEQLGVLEATKEESGNKITYQSHTDIEYHLLATIKVVYDYTVVYVDNALENAKVHITVRGHDRAQVKTVKKGDKNEYYSDGELEKTISGKINNSIEKLFFEEPVGISSVYAEEHGEFHNLKKTGEHTYIKTAPNGHKNTYVYENGVLKRSDVDAGVIEFSIVRN